MGQYGRRLIGLGRRTFADALPIVQDVVGGRKTPAQALAAEKAGG